jgi:hypothetical protein
MVTSSVFISHLAEARHVDKIPQISDRLDQKARKHPDCPTGMNFRFISKLELFQ